MPNENENSIFLHENEISTRENKISRHENEICMQGYEPFAQKSL